MRKTRLPKTRHGKEAKLWRLEGGGLGSAVPAKASPPERSLLRLQACQSLPFKLHVVPPPQQSAPPGSSDWPKATPAVPKASPTPEDLPKLKSHQLAHHWTPPSGAPFLHFPPPLHPSSQHTAPRTRAPIHGDLAPSPPAPRVRRSLRRITHHLGRGLASPNCS